jgi:hypothetical protein
MIAACERCLRGFCTNVQNALHQIVRRTQHTMHTMSLLSCAHHVLGTLQAQHRKQIRCSERPVARVTTAPTFLPSSTKHVHASPSATALYYSSSWSLYAAAASVVSTCPPENTRFVHILAAHGRPFPYACVSTQFWGHIGWIIGAEACHVCCCSGSSYPRPQPACLSLVGSPGPCQTSYPKLRSLRWSTSRKCMAMPTLKW